MARLVSRILGAGAEGTRAIGSRPRSVGAQLALLVVLTVVVTHVLIAAAFFLMGPASFAGGDTPGGNTNRFAVILRMIEATPEDRRRAIFTLAKEVEPALALTWEERTGEDDPAAQGSPASTNHPQGPRLLQILGPGYRLVPMPWRAGDGTEAGRVAVVTPAGLHISATLPFRLGPLPTRWGPALATTIFLAIMLVVLSLWAARALAAPLRRLAEAAEAFGNVDDSTPLPERGPAEVLTVSRALGRMRDRVKRLIDDRTRMLAAISHDLRTPITRMRLRAEFIEDDHARAMTLRDLDQMNALVEAALSYVRDGRTDERMGTLDLAALVQTVCDGFADVGADVEAETLRHVLVNGRSDDLCRALTNLVDNAVKYGGRVRVGMSATATGASVSIADEGPGIPPEEHAAMLRPFVRGDRARNLDGTPGFGLGLSIAVAIAEAHGGSLDLSARAPHGLVATLHLPRAGGMARVAEAPSPRVGEAAAAGA
ncbi:ATP-binding protein [Methylobacterium sp. Leaf399]|uniref:ATP-binding protein n=1 Tax=Methylobacterium sp. Leaf399 TaxID=1736364 RepID=UPI0009E95F6A|nr:ATP-binding protein [Methylobacterium sp. Leaf399]